MPHSRFSGGFACSVGYAFRPVEHSHSDASFHPVEHSHSGAAFHPERTFVAFYFFDLQ
jgi:hypothetical protein